MNVINLCISAVFFNFIYTAYMRLHSFVNFTYLSCACGEMVGK